MADRDIEELRSLLEDEEADLDRVAELSVSLLAEIEAVRADVYRAGLEDAARICEKRVDWLMSSLEAKAIVPCRLRQADSALLCAEAIRARIGQNTTDRPRCVRCGKQSMVKGDWAECFTVCDSCWDATHKGQKGTATVAEAAGSQRPAGPVGPVHPPSAEVAHPCETKSRHSKGQEPT